mmetsp:Transcript_59497/g.117911  ORF Transcript_59497/g.117911 Transcript_59497/m.117911 type:complete len:203 (-) Transcript_59497:2369-2977(-)
MRSPTALTRQPLQRETKSCATSSAASFCPRPKASRLTSIASCFCAVVKSGSSRVAPTSTQKRERSCGRVSSKSFSSVKSQESTSSRSCCTSLELNFGMFKSLKTLLTSMPLLASWTIFTVTSLSMPKNVGTQLVSVEMSSSLSFPFSPIFCLMNILAQRETMRISTFIIFSELRPRMAPTCGLQRSHLSRFTVSWHVTVFHA